MIRALLVAALAGAAGYVVGRKQHDIVFVQMGDNVSLFPDLEDAGASTSPE